MQDLCEIVLGVSISLAGAAKTLRLHWLWIKYIYPRERLRTVHSIIIITIDVISCTDLGKITVPYALSLGWEWDPRACHSWHGQQLFFFAS